MKQTFIFLYSIIFLLIFTLCNKPEEPIEPQQQYELYELTKAQFCLNYNYNHSNCKGFGIKYLVYNDDYFVISGIYKDRTDTLWRYGKDSIYGSFSYFRHEKFPVTDPVVYIKGKWRGHMGYSDFIIEGDFSEQRYFGVMYYTDTTATEWELDIDSSYHTGGFWMAPGCEFDKPIGFRRVIFQN